MTKNNTKVYDMYLDGIYQATGSTKMLADHIRVSRQTLERYLYEGNDKGYTFEHIGKYAQIYALYNKEVFMMFGTLKQLSEHTGMPMTRLEWFRTPSSEKRGGNYQVVKIEGEFEVVRENQKVKHRVNVYELKINYERYSGTVEDIAKQTGWSEAKVRNNGVVIGHRLAKLKGVNHETGEVFYGALQDMADWAGFNINTVRAMVTEQRSTRYFDFTFTGQYIVDLIGADKPKAVKPVSDHVSVKPVYSHKPVPMSRYAKELLDWSTKHLRRDA